ncbi:hypothetical protein [Streptomyces sp. NPDC059816]|uniref:hypothetical protein n=1 Tax=Streptomyces sp. NPDC059816 TaxID=3346960 RepID=UPI0036529A46
MAIVDLEAGAYRVVETENGSTAAGARLVLKRRSFAQPLPETAQWILSSSFSTERYRQTLKHVASGRFLSGATIQEQSQASQTSIVSLLG